MQPFPLSLLDGLRLTTHIEGIRWRRRYFYVRHACLCYDSAKSNVNGPIGVKVPLRFINSCTLASGCCFRIDLAQGHEDAEHDPLPPSLWLRADSEAEVALPQSSSDPDHNLHPLLNPNQANFWVTRLLWLAHLSLEQPATLEEVALLSFSHEAEVVNRKAKVMAPPSMWGRFPSAFEEAEPTTQVLESARAETQQRERRRSWRDGSGDSGWSRQGSSGYTRGGSAPTKDHPPAQRAASMVAATAMTPEGTGSICRTHPAVQSRSRSLTRIIVTATAQKSMTMRRLPSNHTCNNFKCSKSRVQYV